MGWAMIWEMIRPMYRQGMPCLYHRQRNPKIHLANCDFKTKEKNTISFIIGAYKSAVTKHCNRLGFKFAWQTRFYDHIIRDEQSFESISTYIINNPMKWDLDKFHCNQ